MFNKTNLRLKNSWKYKGKDWWDWEAFLDDQGSGELSNVEFVEYILHPTFPEPIRKIRDKTNGFRLKSGGWGVFPLKAFVHTKDGKKLKLEHNLKLQQEPEHGETK